MLLHLALACWAASATADTTTTYQALSNPRYVAMGIHEGNPILAPLSSHPALLATTMAGTDGAFAFVVQRKLAPHHPKLAAVTYFALAASRIYFASKNLEHMHQVDAMPIFIRNF